MKSLRAIVVGTCCAIKIASICILQATRSALRSAHKHKIPLIAVLMSRIGFYVFTNLFLPVRCSCCISVDILLNFCYEQRRMQRSLLCFMLLHIVVIVVVVVVCVRMASWRFLWTSSRFVLCLDCTFRSPRVSVRSVFVKIRNKTDSGRQMMLHMQMHFWFSFRFASVFHKLSGAHFVVVKSCADLFCRQQSGIEYCKEIQPEFLWRLWQKLH